MTANTRKKRPRGRPKLPASQRRERAEWLSVRLSAAEQRALARAAGDQPISTWARGALLAAAASVGE